MNLFQYAVIKDPTDKEAEDGGKSVLVVPITSVLASNEQAAVLLAGRAIPEAYLADIDRLRVVVRPF